MPLTVKNAASATPAKRASEGVSSEESPAKRAAPLYANLTLMDAPKRQVAQRLPPTAPCCCCTLQGVYVTRIVAHTRTQHATQVTNRAGDVWSNFEGTDAQLFQIQVDHQARPSIVFGLRESVNEFLEDANSKSEDIPATLDSLQSSGIRLVITDKANQPNRYHNSHSRVQQPLWQCCGGVGPARFRWRTGATTTSPQGFKSERRVK